MARCLRIFIWYHALTFVDEGCCFFKEGNLGEILQREINCRIEMYCFVFWKTKRLQDICLSEEFLQLSLFSCGWKYFEICQRVSSLFLFLPTTRKIILSFCLKYSNPTLCSLSRRINSSSEYFQLILETRTRTRTGTFELERMFRIILRYSLSEWRSI